MSTTDDTSSTALDARAQELVSLLAAQVRDLLARLGEVRMYRTPEERSTLIKMTAGWMTTEANTMRPFVPAAGVTETVQTTIRDYLTPFVEPYIGAYPTHNLNAITHAAARDLVATFDAAGLLVHDLPDDPHAADLREAVTYVMGRTHKRDGTMGGGYYPAYVSAEDLAAALYAAGWRKG